jgi:hypothetical protein
MVKWLNRPREILLDIESDAARPPRAANDCHLDILPVCARQLVSNPDPAGRLLRWAIIGGRLIWRGSGWRAAITTGSTSPHRCRVDAAIRSVLKGATRKEMISILRLLGRRADLLLRGTTSRMPSLVQGSSQTMSSGTASRVTTRAAPKLTGRQPVLIDPATL